MNSLPGDEVGTGSEYGDDSEGSSATDVLESDPDAAADYVVNWFMRGAGKVETTQYPTGLAYDERMLRHRHPRADHPESPERVETIMRVLEQTRLADRMYRIPIQLAADSHLLLVHNRNHLGSVNALEDPGTRQARYHELESRSAYASEGTVEAAYVAAGAVISAVEAVSTNIVRNAICVVRPPGHHAERSEICGFCLFDNVAVAAAVAIEKYNFQRVLILDWDIHHGNGIQHAFEGTSKVLYMSIHRWDHGAFYPGGEGGGPHMVGTGAGKGYNINVGWNGADAFADEDYFAAFDRVIMPAARAYDPDLVFVSAGFDAAIGDPLGGCEVTPNGYAQMLHQLRSLARGKIIVALEGGYHLGAISASMLMCSAVLLGDTMALSSRRRGVLPRANEAIEQTIECHSALNVSFSKLWTGVHGLGNKHGIERRESLSESQNEDDGNNETESDHLNDAEVEADNSNGNESNDEFQLAEPDFDDPNYFQDNVQPLPDMEDGRPTAFATCEACPLNVPVGELNWVCLKCHSVFCSNKSYQGHQSEHAMKTGHPIALCLTDLTILDFAARKVLNGITNPDLRPILQIYHEERFGRGLPPVKSSLV